MLTDAELVEMARQGDAGARDELVRRYQRQTALLAAALVNDLAEGEDLGQEAFVRAFRNLDLLVDPSRFGAWLRRIAFGVSIDWLRSFRPDLYRGWDGQGEAPVADPGPSPLDRLLGAEMAERVARALAALPPRYRAPLRLFHMDGLSHAKVAETLGLPVGTVRSLVTRPRAEARPASRRSRARCAVAGGRAISGADDVRLSAPLSARRQRGLHHRHHPRRRHPRHVVGLGGRAARGPVPAGLSDHELIGVRARHLHDNTPWGPTLDDVVAQLHGWRTAVDGRAGCDEMILWFEHDLFDQLNLIQVLDRLVRVETEAPVSLICIGSFPGRPNFKGLGQLTPDELASLLETRQPVSVIWKSTRGRLTACRAPSAASSSWPASPSTPGTPFTACPTVRPPSTSPTPPSGRWSKTWRPRPCSPFWPSRSPDRTSQTISLTDTGAAIVAGEHDRIERA